MSFSTAIHYVVLQITKPMNVLAQKRVFNDIIGHQEGLDVDREKLDFD